MQAVIITAYTNPEQLIELIGFFKDKMMVYVHIDKKSDLDPEEIQAHFLGYKNLCIIKKYRVPWASFYHLQAILDLIEMAVADPRINYIHTISAQDYPVIPLSDFEQRFDDCKTIYLTCEYKDDLPSRFRSRYKVGILSSKWDIRSPLVKQINKIWKKYRRKHMKKGIGDITEIYKGTIWFSMPKEPAAYVLSYLFQNKKYVKDLIHVKLPEEFVFQPILMNSEYKSDIISDNLRYTVWEERNGSFPAYLDMTDFDAIRSSNNIFARKIHPEISHELIERIKPFL